MAEENPIQVSIDSYLYYCIDPNTDNYETINTRIDAGETTIGKRAPFIRGANMHVLINTIGSKRTVNYVSELVVARDFYPENRYVLEVRNNLCFHTVSTGADQVTKQNKGSPLQDTSKNIYSSDPIAAGILLDTLLCYLNPSGPAIDRTLVFPLIRTDIDGNSRPVGRSSDIGARESQEYISIPYSDKGGLPMWVFPVSACLVTVLIFLANRRQVSEKVKKSRFLIQA